MLENFVEYLHGIGRWVSNTDGIGVKADFWQQPQAADNENHRHRQHASRVTYRQCEQALDPRRSDTERMQPGVGCKLQYHCREKGKVGKKRYEHSGSCDQSKLTYPGKIGRNESEKSHGCGYGAHDERAAYAGGSGAQSSLRRCTLAELIAELHADMDGEVDSEPDEQDAEGDGYEIQMADGRGCESGCPDEPHEQGDDRAENQPQGSQSKQQNDGHHCERCESRPRNLLTHVLRLLIGKGKGAGGTHANAVVSVEPQLGQNSAQTE